MMKFGFKFLFRLEYEELTHLTRGLNHFPDGVGNLAEERVQGWLQAVTQQRIDGGAELFQSELRCHATAAATICTTKNIFLINKVTHQKQHSGFSATHTQL
jgi:hypothetical protein